MARSYIGVNTDGINFYSPQAPTINALKYAESKVSAGGTGVVHDAIPGLGGVYTIQDATINGANSINIPDKQVFITGLKDIGSNPKIIRPNYTGNEGDFTNEFKKAFEPFGAIRLMNWTKTNNSPVASWSQRCKYSDLSWSDPNGGPWEPMFEYAESHNKGLWICIPHQADDDYVLQLARLASRYAIPQLYIEHTNEYWNWQFSQAKWIDVRSRVLASSWNLNDDGKNGDELRHRYHAKRTIEIGKVFSSNKHANTKISPVLGCGIAASGAATDALGWVRRQYGTNHGLYAIAPAVYFASSIPSGSGGWSADQYADHALTSAKRLGTSSSNTTTALRQFRALSDKAGMELVAYEGGLDLGQDAVTNPNKVASQMLPQVEEAVEIWANWWFKEGGKELFYYKNFSLWNKSGVWGLSDQPNKLDTPKYRALAKVASEKPMDGSTPTPTPTPTPIPTPTPPPAVVLPPTNLVVILEGSKLKATWRKVDGATYKVYRNGVQIGTSTDETFFWSDTSSAEFQVSSVKNGQESAKSDKFIYGVPSKPTITSVVVNYDDATKVTVDDKPISKVVITYKDGTTKTIA